MSYIFFAKHNGKCRCVNEEPYGNEMRIRLVSLNNRYCFNGRSTNAAAESFNAKIKEFRRQFRGVTDVKFFLYRLCKIYA